MTVLIRQRKPDPGTLDRHNYVRQNVVRVKVYKGIDKCYYLYLRDEEGDGIHFALDSFDFEIL